jgi:uncharacterized membrane protein SpoIIM required for sporulation
METLIAVLVGLGLAAAAGFRIFVPLLAVGLASRFAELPLTESFSWMGSTPALLVFGAATVVEILAYYVPWIDNLLDTAATPMAVLAGAVLTAAVVTDVDPVFRWSLAIVAGGGTASIFQGLTAGTRGISSLSTGGLGNPVVATAEWVGSVVLSVLAVVVPVLAVVVIALILAWVGRRAARRRPAKAA